MGIPIQISNKIFSLSDAVAQAEEWKMSGDKLVFTNGVFDLMHPGHVTYLTEASEFGDRLIIGLNADSSVKKLDKGDDRPINNEESRAVMLAALSCTSMIVIFDQETPLELINSLHPAVLVKGGDYAVEAQKGQKDYIVGSEEIKEWGGTVKCIPFLPNHSSTSIINKIRKFNG